MKKLLIFIICIIALALVGCDVLTTVTCDKYHVTLNGFGGAYCGDLDNADVVYTHALIEVADGVWEPHAIVHWRLLSRYAGDYSTVYELTLDNGDHMLVPVEKCVLVESYEED